MRGGGETEERACVHTSGCVGVAGSMMWACLHVVMPA